MATVASGVTYTTKLSAKPLEGWMDEMVPPVTLSADAVTPVTSSEKESAKGTGDSVVMASTERLAVGLVTS